MNPREFCVWLHGVFEATGSPTLGERHTKMIRDKLDAVFEHVVGDIDTDAADDPDTEKPSNKPFTFNYPDGARC